MLWSEYEFTKDKEWNSKYNLNSDKIIDIIDINILAKKIYYRYLKSKFHIERGFIKFCEPYFFFIVI